MSCDYNLTTSFGPSSTVNPKHFGKKLFFPIEKVQNKYQTSPHIEKNKLLLNEYLGNLEL